MTDEEMAGGMTDEQVGAPAKRQSKFPQSRRLNKDGQPESLNEESERLGVAEGPITSHRMPGVGLTVHARDPGPVERDQLIDEYIDGTMRIENAAGAAVGGGVMGTIARGSAVPSIGTGANAMSAFARGAPAAAAAPRAGNALQTGILGALLGQGLGGGESGGTGALAGGVAGLLLPPAFRALLGAAPAVGAAALPVAGAAVGGAGSIALDENRLTPQQRAVRILLGQPPQFPQGE